MDNKLLTREEFKQQVFARTGGKCCVPGCNCDAVDAHHIMDRKLFDDNGYYLWNGAALCAKHHLDAENSIILPGECLDYMGIDPMECYVPDKLKDEYKNQPGYHYGLALGSGLIDKWGKSVNQEYDENWYKRFVDKKINK